VVPDVVRKTVAADPCGRRGDGALRRSGGFWSASLPRMAWMLCS